MLLDALLQTRNSLTVHTRACTRAQIIKEERAERTLMGSAGGAGGAATGLNKKQPGGSTVGDANK